MKKYILTALIVAFMAPDFVFAQANCKVMATCEELGYIYESGNTDPSKPCYGLSELKCPFDQTKVYCKAYEVVPCKVGMRYDTAIGGCNKYNTGDRLVTATRTDGTCDMIILSGYMAPAATRFDKAQEYARTQCSGNGYSLASQTDVFYADIATGSSVVTAEYVLGSGTGIYIPAQKLISEYEYYYRTELYGYACSAVNVSCGSKEDGVARNVSLENPMRCSVCHYTYDPVSGDADNGIAPGTSFEDIADDWVCPICGSGKDSFEEIDDTSAGSMLCSVCHYTYDPAVGDTDNGIAPGTSFEEIPDDWVCPICGSGKDSFETVD